MWADPDRARRAGGLAKRDLPSAMVGEFPEFQGHTCRLYAEHGGEPVPVALAIQEHDLPRFAGEGLSTSPAGVALALAQRDDTLTACFGIGLAPRGGGDPLGLGLLLAVATAFRTLADFSLISTALTPRHRSQAPLAWR